MNGLRVVTREQARHIRIAHDTELPSNSVEASLLLLSLHPDGECPLPPDPADDLHERWLPSFEMQDMAERVLATSPKAGRVMIPLIQPGKQYGLWFVGQQVHTVPVVIQATHDDTGEGMVLPYARARELAIRIGEALLEGEGTIAHASMRRDDPGNWVVFEEIAL